MRLKKVNHKFLFGLWHTVSCKYNQHLSNTTYKFFLRDIHTWVSVCGELFQGNCPRWLFCGGGQAGGGGLHFNAFYRPIPVGTARADARSRSSGDTTDWLARVSAGLWSSPTVASRGGRIGGVAWLRSPQLHTPPYIPVLFRSSNFLEI